MDPGPDHDQLEQAKLEAERRRAMRLLQKAAEIREATEARKRFSFESPTNAVDSDEDSVTSAMEQDLDLIGRQIRFSEGLRRVTSDESTDSMGLPRSPEDEKPTKTSPLKVFESKRIAFAFVKAQAQHGRGTTKKDLVTHMDNQTADVFSTPSWIQQHIIPQLAKGGKGNKALYFPKRMEEVPPEAKPEKLTAKQQQQRDVQALKERLAKAEAKNAKMEEQLRAHDEKIKLIETTLINAFAK